MKTTNEFAEGDRYRYDFGLCKDFAHLDTSEDASYYGNWACPDRLLIFSFCEGDCTTTECDTVEEFKAELYKFRDFANRMGGFLGVDPGSDTKAKAWEAIGLSDLLHSN